MRERCELPRASLLRDSAAAMRAAAPGPSGALLYWVPVSQEGDSITSFTQRAASTGNSLPAPAALALMRFVRARLASQVYDDAPCAAQGTAIYTLSDPRDLRAVRYVGQTRAPRRRFLQHVRTARLWLPAELPWWVVEERYRPLYEWIRALFRDEQRLPVMIVTAWHDVPADATVAERAAIQDWIRRDTALLNVGCAAPTPQLRLL
jgi:hypothetical protein